MATFRQATPDACRGCTRRSPPGTCTEWPHRKGHSQDWEWTHFGVVMTMSLHICMLGLRAPVSGVRTQTDMSEETETHAPRSCPLWRKMGISAPIVTQYGHRRGTGLGTLKGFTIQQCFGSLQEDSELTRSVASSWLAILLYSRGQWQILIVS